MYDEPLKVREFNIIVSKNKDLPEDYQKERIYKLDKDAFDELKEFVCGTTSDSEDASSIGSFSCNSYLGEYVTLQNYVGLIELPCGKKIQVMPKLDIEKSSSEKVKGVTVETILTDMLEYYLGKKYKVSGMAALDTKDVDIYEIFISMYLEEVEALVNSGLKSAYISNEDNLHVLKGKLLFNDHLRYNLAHKERFYVSYDEYDINRPLNKIIKATLKKLFDESGDEHNRKVIRQLLAYFVDVDESVNYDYDFSKIVIDRSISNYEQLIDWSKIFLYDKSFSNFAGDTGAKALLFPMEDLFETYVAEKLREYVQQKSDLAWIVSTQAREKYLYQLLNGKASKKFLLKPDILVKSKEYKPDKNLIVMDTKWKRLNSDAGNHYGIKSGDMYQMFAYSKKYLVEHIWLLYPYHKDIKELMQQHSNDILFQSVVENNIMVP